MLIDPNPQTRGPANTQTSPNAQAPLSPELAKLVADLKLSIGQSLEALVTRVQVVTEAERQELLNLQPVPPKNQAQRQLQALLQEPGLKLVELKIQQSMVPALTSLPVTKAQALQVLLTPRGLMLVPPQPAAAAAVEALAHQALSAATAPPAADASAGAMPKPVPLPGQPASSTQPGLPPGTATPQGIAMPQVNAPQPGPAAPPAELAQAAARQASPTVPSSGRPATQAPSGLPQLETPPLKPGAATTAKSPDPAADPLPASRVRPLIADTLARTLPQAQPLPPLLKALDQLNRQLQTLPPEKLPPQVRQLQTLLKRLPAMSLNLAQLDPARPQALRRALEQSGVFYEHRLLQGLDSGAEQATRKLPEQDLKGLLIQLQQWLGAPAAPAPNRLPVTDTLSQLLFGLVQVFLPHQKPRPDSSALQQLKEAVQQRVEQSLARVQTQQMRTLSNQMLDPAAPQQWHLDIPLRLPEGYGNLYLHLFEPRVPPEPDREPGKKDPRRLRKGRWRVFMELELDELGGMAAEIAVLEKDLEITLWAERAALRERANGHLRELRQDLERQGLVVRELQCSHNPPPEQKVRLDYALIDVKT